MPTIMLLERWSDNNNTSKFRVLSIDSLKWEEVNSNLVSLSIDGWFEEYSEGLFAVFCDHTKQAYVFWNGSIYYITYDTTIEWNNTVYGRLFRLIKNNQAELEFNYMTWHKFITHPWAIITEIFLPDDDYGLINDLPGYVHSLYRLGKSIHYGVSQWNLRYNRNP